MKLFESFEKLEFLKQRVSNKEHFFIIVNTKEIAYEVEKLIIDKLGFKRWHDVDYINSTSFDGNNLARIEVDFENEIVTASNTPPYVITGPHRNLFPQWSKDKDIILNAMGIQVFPSYKPRRFITESVDVHKIGVKCITYEDCLEFETFLHENGWVYTTGVKNLIEIGRYDRLTFYNFDKDSKRFTARADDFDGDDNYTVYNYPEQKNNILHLFRSGPTYRPKQFVYESTKEKKILNAFDMDDTLVYSKRFEDHIKPMLIREYLTPEIILNNKLEDIGIGIEQLKYENGRIYFDDPNHSYKIPTGSSWVRKKERIYIIQPDAYFMTDESMPIGRHNDIIQLYDDSKFKCIITARNERLRSQTKKVLNKLGLEKPNIGLFMYPINSFSYVYEYKCNKLIELQTLYNFDEIHYYDDNIKLLKKMKKNFKYKDIPITLYKVTENKYRKI